MATSRAKATAPGEQVAFDDAVDDARCERLCRADGFAERAHLRGLRDARQARQPLRAAGAGDDPELHFRLSDLRRGAATR